MWCSGPLISCCLSGPVSSLNQSLLCLSASTVTCFSFALCFFVAWLSMCCCFFGGWGGDNYMMALSLLLALCSGLRDCMGCWGSTPGGPRVRRAPSPPYCLLWPLFCDFSSSWLWTQIVEVFVRVLRCDLQELSNIGRGECISAPTSLASALRPLDSHG